MEAAFRIHPELRDYIRRESEEERAMLEQSILSEGCRDPLVVWKEENVLVDGHHRLEICERHGISYIVKHQSFPDAKAAKAWMRRNQLARRNLDKAERDQWIKELRAGGWTQQAVADELNVSQGRIAQIERKLLAANNPDQPSPKPAPAEDKEKALLKEQVAYYERLAKSQEEEIRELARARKALDEMAFDRNAAREEARATAKELERLRDAVPEKEVVTVRVEDAGATAAKLAELERALAEAEAARRRLESEREEIRRERGDMEKLEKECQMLEGKKRHIQAEIVSASVMEKIQKRLFSEHDAFVHGAAALRIVTGEILERDDCAGLSVEALEQLERDIAKVGVCVRELIPAIHAVIEKIKGGGALRIVKA